MSSVAPLTVATVKTEHSACLVSGVHSGFYGSYLIVSLTGSKENNPPPVVTQQVCLENGQIFGYASK